MITPKKLLLFRIAAELKVLRIKLAREKAMAEEKK